MFSLTWGFAQCRLPRQTSPCACKCTGISCCLRTSQFMYTKLARCLFSRKRLRHIQVPKCLRCQRNHASLRIDAEIRDDHDDDDYDNDYDYDDTCIAATMRFSRMWPRRACCARMGSLCDVHTVYTPSPYTQHLPSSQPSYYTCHCYRCCYTPVTQTLTLFR